MGASKHRRRRVAVAMRKSHWWPDEVPSFGQFEVPTLLCRVVSSREALAGDLQDALGRPTTRESLQPCVRSAWPIALRGSDSRS